MRSFASGPLGVLLMVAPLVAIPLLSTLGIPQLFNPVEASPVGGDQADEKVVPFSALADEEDSLAEDRLEAPLPRRQPTHQSTRKTSRSKSSRPQGMISTTLFEPVDDGAPADASRELADNNSDGGIVSLLSNEGGGNAGKDGSDLPPRGSLDGFETLEPEHSLTRPKAPKHRVLPDESQTESNAQPSTTELLTKPADDEELRRPAKLSRKKSPAAELKLAQAGGTSAGNRSLPKDQTVAPLLGSVAPAGSDNFTVRQAQERLNELGIRNFNIQSLADYRFRFTCSVTNPDNPQVTRRFVAEADEIPLAVQQALQQVEEWLATR